MAPELGNKSSSAPVIMKKPVQFKDIEKPEDEAKKRVSLNFFGGVSSYWKNS